MAKTMGRVPTISSVGGKTEPAAFALDGGARAWEIRRAGLFSETMPTCLQCRSENIASGAIVESGGCNLAVFQPRPLRHWTFTISGGTSLDENSFACLECGLVWSFTPPAKLRKFIDRHCSKADA